MFGPSLSARSGSGCVSKNKSVGAGGQGAPGQDRRKLALPRRLVPAPAGQLHRMSRIENDRAAKAA